MYPKCTFLAQIRTIIEFSSVLTAVNNRRILHRCVIVMLYFQVGASGNLNFDEDDEINNLFPTTSSQDIHNVIAAFWDDLECAKVYYRETTDDSFIMVSQNKKALNSRRTRIKNKRNSVFDFPIF